MIDFKIFSTSNARKNAIFFSEIKYVYFIKILDVGLRGDMNGGIASPSRVISPNAT